MPSLGPSSPTPATSPSARPGRLAVGVLGVGRVGATLGPALERAGHRLVGATAVSAASRRRAADRLPDVPLLAPDELVARSSLVLLTVPDDVLAGLVEGLAATGCLSAGTLVVHTSGRFGIAVLAPLTRAGGLPLALHPAMTFAGTDTDLARLSGATFGVTTTEALRPVGEALVIEMGAEPAFVAEAARPLYHAALAGAANHIVTLVTTACDQLRLAGVELPERMLAPLLGAALDNALRYGDAALTGPVSRGDAGTVAAHLAALAAAAPETVGAYRALARLTADRAIAAGRLTLEAAEPLLDVLSGDGGGP